MSGTSIKIENAVFDDDERGLIVKGFIDPNCLRLLQVDDYQREELSDKKVRALVDALRTGRVPDIELGMRGENVTNRGNVFYLQDPTYIVDGLQRVTAGMRLVQAEPDVSPRIGVTVHLATDFEWERKRFDVLNVGQTKLSGNVTLRNLLYDIEVVKVLHALTNGKNKSFVMHGKVSWDQSMKRSEFISATTYVKVVGLLHSHIGPGKSNNGTQLANGLQKILENSGRNTFIANVKLFFEVIDKAHGIQTVAYKDTANHLKMSYLMALARMFSEYANFWDDAKLVVDDLTIKRLSSFAMNDPAVSTLCGSAGKSSELLTQLLVEHVNSNRRRNRLVRRSYADAYGYEREDEEQS